MTRYTLQQILDTVADPDNDVTLADIEVDASLAPGQQQLAAHESEHGMQARIFAEAAVRSLSDDRWRMLYAVPNGQYRPGQRPEPGLAAGYPDIALDIMARGYGGLRIELKVGKNKTSRHQNWWLNALNDRGYYAIVCRSYEETIATIEEYLS